LTAPAHDPLQALRDLHLPAAPGWFPPAPGWWILLAIVLGAACYTAYRLWRRQRRRAPYRAAIRELEAARAQGVAPGVGPSYADAANAILKRVAIHALKRSEAAPLSGERWLTFLDALDPTGDFTRGPGRALGDARFAPAAQVDVDALHPRVVRLLAHLERRA
jgi:hypothetical protein